MWLKNFLKCNDVTNFAVNIVCEVDRSVAHQIINQVFDDYKSDAIFDDNKIRLLMNIQNVSEDGLTLYKLLSEKAPWKPFTQMYISFNDMEKRLENNEAFLIVMPKIKEVIKTKEVPVTSDKLTMSDNDKELLFKIINELENRPAILSYLNDKIMNNEISQAKLADTKKANVLRQLL